MYQRDYRKGTRDKVNKVIRGIIGETKGIFQGPFIFAAIFKFAGTVPQCEQDP